MTNPTALSPTANPLRESYLKLPKVELHRHLEGSLRLDTMLDVAKTFSLPLPGDPSALSRLVQVQKDDAASAENFLAKFASLRQFFCAPEVIERITREAVADAAADNIRYMELRFTPVALSRIKQFALADVMDWVCASAAAAAREHGVMVRLIASTNRHESVELADQVAKLAAQRIDKGIVAFDLAGNEAQFAAMPFLPIFQAARQSGLAVTLHAGEWSGAANVREAIEQFGATRIGHGVRTLEDAAVTQLARERGTVFEVCITSNYQTGVAKSLASHPFVQMLNNGLNATLHTDDPSVSQITLSDEYEIACNELKLSPERLKQCVLAAAEAAFLPEAQKQTLVSELSQELARVLPTP